MIERQAKGAFMNNIFLMIFLIRYMYGGDEWLQRYSQSTFEDPRPLSLPAATLRQGFGLPERASAGSGSRPVATGLGSEAIKSSVYLTSRVEKRVSYVQRRERGNLTDYRGKQTFVHSIAGNTWG